MVDGQILRERAQSLSYTFGTLNRRVRKVGVRDGDVCSARRGGGDVRVEKVDRSRCAILRN